MYSLNVLTPEPCQGVCKDELDEAVQGDKVEDNVVDDVGPHDLHGGPLLLVRVLRDGRLHVQGRRHVHVQVTWGHGGADGGAMWWWGGGSVRWDLVV